MAKTYKKKDDKTLEILESIVNKREVSLDSLISNKQSLQKAVDATQQSIDKLDLQMIEIDNNISEARALGIKTQAEIDAEA